MASLQQPSDRSAPALGGGDGLAGQEPDIAREAEPDIPENAIELMVGTQMAHYQLSQMADQKASILMGTTFVIFTIVVGQPTQGTLASLPLLVLGAFSFVSALLSVAAILPATKVRKDGSVNLLFFGSFLRFTEKEYLDRIVAMLSSDEQIYRTIARDIYQNGTVLGRKKYRLLGYAYRVFLIGLTGSFVTFVIQLLKHGKL